MCDITGDNGVKGCDKHATKLSYQDKYDIICKIERGVNRKQLLVEYNLKRYSNLTNILKNKSKIIERVTQSTAQSSQKTFRLRTAHYDKVEEALVLWVKQMILKRVELSSADILQKAKEFGTELGFTDFEPTTGYLNGFKRRNNSLFPEKLRENGCFNESVATNWTQELNEVTNHYKPEDVFSLQEFPLYWRLLPIRSKDNKSEDRITCVVICNASGSERNCSVIGSHKNPRALRGVKCLPLDYYSQTDSLIDSHIYRQILDKLNKQMKNNMRNIVMFVNNRISHSNDTQFSNIRIEFFPPNCEIELQPLDQWFVIYVKRLYRKQLTERLISRLESGLNLVPKDITLLDCMSILDNCLQSIPKQTISDCFKKSNFNFDSMTEISDYFEDSFDTSLDFWSKLNSLTKSKFKTFDDYLNIDNNEVIEFTGHLTDDQIVEQVVRHESSVDDDQSDGLLSEEDLSDTQLIDESISTAEALNAISVLRRYFDQIGDNSVDQQLIDIQMRVIDNTTTNGYLALRHNYQL